MQDESGDKMSLKDRGVGMLGIDYPQNTSKLNLQRSKLQRGDSIQRQRAGRDSTLRQHGYSRQNRADKGVAIFKI